MEHDFHALAHDAAGARKDRGQRRIGEPDALVRVDDQHRLLHASECRFELGKLARSLRLQADRLGNQIVGCMAKLVEVACVAAHDLILPQTGLAGRNGLPQFPRDAPVVA